MCKLRGLLAIVSTTILWSLAIVLIKYLSIYFDVATQNWIRYSSASLFLLLLSLSRLRELKETFIDKATLLPAFLVFSFQTLAVHGLYMTKSTIASLLMRTSVVFTVILSYILFKEERHIIKSKQFTLGSLIAFIGVVGIYYKPGEFVEWSESLGTLLVILGSLMWSGYVVSVRKLLKGRDPLLFTTAVISVSSLMFIPHVMINGRPLQILNRTLEVNVILIVSGILGVGLGNWMNYIAMKELGAVIPSVLRLLVPLFTGVLSFLILGETLLLSEIIFGGILLLGCSIVIHHTTRVTIEGQS